MPPDRPYPGRPPRLERVFGFAPVYFVTFCTDRRKPWLACKEVHTAFIQFAERARDEHQIQVGCYVLVPDHVHLFVTGGPAFRLGEWMRLLKQSLRKAAPKESPGPHWQPGFFDHLLRHDESMAQKWEYICQNPVRAGLCIEPKDWPYRGEIAKIDRA